ncbi:MAG: PEGA domain-containing protein [Endomicrobium sp.]|jgi:hypothetical protein|nr:PEGA domain-containing protein [Endomicrobium sp.]
MKKEYFQLFVLAIIGFSFSSCALIFNGTRQSVSVKSMTQGSKIYIDGNYEGNDCVSMKLKRDRNHSVIIKKEGYQTEAMNIDSHVQPGWVAYGVLNNFALITDAVTGAWNSLDKTNIVVELEPNLTKKA